MPQIIEENRRPSFAQNFGQAIGGALQGANQYQDFQKSQKMNSQANQMAQQLLGMDVSGLDPKTRDQLILESFKQQGKGERQDKTQTFLSKLFGGEQEANPNQSGMQSNNEMPSIEAITGQKPHKDFNASKLTDEDIAIATSLDPNLGRALGHAKDVALRENREVIKADTTEKNRARKEEIEFHKESQKYDEDLNEKARRAKNQVETFTDIEKAINSGNVKPSSWTNILRNFGDTGRNLSNAIMNKDEATLLSSIPQLLEGWKQVFGIRLTDADLKILQDKLPDIGKSPEANKAILKVMKKYGEMSSLRHKIATDIKKGNKGIRPLGYADMIEERFDEMVKPVKIINPKTGNTIEIPAYKMGDAINSGARLADE